MVHNLPLLITTISLQIVGVRFPGPILKLLATAIGLYTLLYYATSKPTGPYLDVWVFGMNLWGVVVKAINIFWFRRAEELKRAPRPVARAHSFPLDKTSNAYVGSKNWIQGIRKLIDNVKLFLGELAEAAEELLTLRGVGWYVPSTMQRSRSCLHLSGTSKPREYRSHRQLHTQDIDLCSSSYWASGGGTPCWILAEHGSIRPLSAPSL